MNKFRSTVAALTSVALLAGTSLAFAQHHRDRDHDHDAHHAHAVKEAKQKAALARAVRQEHKWGVAERRRANAWRDAYLRQQAATRARRRAAALAAARRQWARDHWVWAHAEVRTELELDAWRIARIDALRALALREARHDLVVQLDELRIEEIARHNRRMAYFRVRWGR